MIDFIEITTYLCKDTPNLTTCKESITIHRTGAKRYTIAGCNGNDMQVDYNPANGWLRLAGSLPKFWQGHNFSYSLQDCLSTIDYLSNILQVDLMQAEVKKVEYGVVIPVADKPELYIMHHCCLKGSKLKQEVKYDGRERQWFDTSTHRGQGLNIRNAPVVIKMYDAGYRLKTTTTKEIRQAIEAYNPALQYIKFEVHYNKGLHHLNRNKGVTLAELMGTTIQQLLGVDLLQQYNRLMITKDLQQPTTKGDASALDIALQLIAYKVVNDEGKTLQAVREQLYFLVDQQGVLTKADRDARKATIRKAFAKLQELPSSKWVLSEQVGDAICNEWDNNL